MHASGRMSAAPNRDSPGRRWLSRARVERRRLGVGEDPIVLVEPATGIEHDAQRIRSGHLPRRQQRIVGGHGAGAHHHRVGQRAHAMQVEDVLRTGHELRVAGRAWR